MRTRRSQSSSDPVPSPFERAQGKSGIEPKAASRLGHIPVLLHEVIGSLAIAPNDVVVDATVGGGGHAKYIAEKLADMGMLIGFDLDQDAIARTREALRSAKPKVHVVQANFRNLAIELEKLEVRKVDKVVFDLGWSSLQLGAGRGFSFLSDEPLLMTYASALGQDALTAERIVNTWSESSIADVIFGWGEERYARRIAKAIVARRSKAPFKTSFELAEAIKDAVPGAYRHGRIHPATRTFQALRIAVNDELGALKDGLEGAWKLLEVGGRIAVITFHSIEDRLTKQMFAEWEKSGEGIRVFKKPIRPSPEEVRENPRSRSAKLRVFEKTDRQLTTDN